MTPPAAQRPIKDAPFDAGSEFRRANRVGRLRDHVEPMPRRSDKRRACQQAIRIKTNSFAFFEKIVVRISIDKRRDLADDQSFLAIRDVNKGIKGVDQLLFVLGNVFSSGIEREGAGQRNARRVFRVNAGALTKRRHRRADDPFGKSFLVDVGDIENFKTARAIRGVEIFATKPDILDVFARMFVCFGEQRTAIKVFLVIRRISDLMQVTADGGLRLVGFCPNNGVEPMSKAATLYCQRLLS